MTEKIDGAQCTWWLLKHFYFILIIIHWYEKIRLQIIIHQELGYIMPYHVQPKHNDVIMRGTVSHWAKSQYKTNCWWYLLLLYQFILILTKPNQTKPIQTKPCVPIEREDIYMASVAPKHWIYQNDWTCSVRNPAHACL